MPKPSTNLLQAVIRPVGVVTGGLALAMAMCSALGRAFQWSEGGIRPIDVGSSRAMIVAAAITAVCGIGMYLMGRDRRNDPLSRREAVLVVAMIWVGTGVFGGLPFMLDAGMGPADAFFEAISGFTTTGATVITEIEATISRPLLLWRSVIQWLGGMGVVVLFVAVMPNIGAGGKHMFRSEAPGPPSGGLRPRIAQTSLVLWRLYASFTALLILLLWGVGAATATPDKPVMGLFDSVNHALTTMSTGGFSTRDGSIGAYDNVAIELLLAAFMIIAGVNFGLYYAVLRNRTLRVFVRSTEFKVYMGLCITAFAALTLANWQALAGDAAAHSNLWHSMRSAVFLTATTITSTGYGTDSPQWTAGAGAPWPGPALMVILLLMFVGGSAGSTAGGVKVARVVLLLRTAWGQVRKSFRPSVVHVVRMSRKAVHKSVLAEVLAFFVIFTATLALGTWLITITDGVGPAAAFGAMLSCVSNMGPHPFHEWAGDNFAPYSPIAKFIFALAMILGRLEFFTLLALLLPDFWRQ